MRAISLCAVLIALTACKGGDDGTPSDPDDTGAPVDADADGYNTDEDCDDGNADIHPGAIEACNGLDDNCDGQIDEGLLVTLFADDDNDGVGGAEVEACPDTPGLEALGGDCDDTDPAVFPGAIEVCNGVDDDCDGGVDAGAIDAVTWYEDFDGDGFGSAATSALECAPPQGYVDNDLDCDDLVAQVNPDAGELCNDIDDDCDTEIDEDDASDAPTWYADADGDGYGDASQPFVACASPSSTVSNDSDCDDDNAAINPGQSELCNGVDDDCDSGTGEDGTALFTATDGSTTDLTGDFSGSSSSAAGVVLRDEGSLALCDGTFYARLEVDADVTIAGFSGDASAVVLDGAGDGTVIELDEDGLSVVLQDLTITGGQGDDSDVVAFTRGGGVACEGTGLSLEISGVVFEGNASEEWGGALFGYDCDTTLDDVHFTGNSADSVGGAVALIDGDHSWTNVVVDDNTSYDIGGLYILGYLEAPVVSFDEVEVSGNVAEDDVGGAAFVDVDVVWAGTSGSTSGVIANEEGGDLGNLYLYGVHFEADVVDFGDNGTGFDNTEYDIYVVDSGSEYIAANDASFECDSTCGSSDAYEVADATNSYEDPTDDYFANVFLADERMTLDSFEVFVSADSGCTADFFLYEASAFSSSTTWTEVWSTTGVAYGGSAGWVDSGDIGEIVEPGTYYALGWGPACSSGNYQTYYYDTTSAAFDGGFGDGVGYAYDDYYDGSPDPTNTTLYLSPLYMTVNVTGELQ